MFDLAQAGRMTEGPPECSGGMSILVSLQSGNSIVFALNWSEVPCQMY